MTIPRMRVFILEKQKHYTVVCLDFRKDIFFSKYGDDIVIGKISKHTIEMQAPITDNRGFDIYDGDIVRYQRDRYLITYDEEHGAFVGKNQTKSHKALGRLNDMSMLALGGKCELLGPEITGH